MLQLFRSVPRLVSRQRRLVAYCSLNKINTRHWQNWTGNINNSNVILHGPQKNVQQPVNESELSNIVINGTKLRVLGQGHCQSPTVVDYDTTDTTVIDLSCYADLGENNNAQYEILDGDRVRVNAGVREDDLDVFLADNGLTLQTATAGGFFSIGGMTSIDVHGATIDCGIFAETAVEFKVMGPNGKVRTITEETTIEDGVTKEIDFIRVNFGAFGIVTSITVQCIKRDSVEGVHYDEKATTADEFAQLFVEKTDQHQIVETFFNTYSGDYGIACWDVNKANEDNDPIDSVFKNACDTYPDKGAGFIPWPFNKIAERGAIVAQCTAGNDTASNFVTLVMGQSRNFIEKAQENYQLLWLSENILRVMFMSYFIPIGKKVNGSLTQEGLENAWRAMNVVKEKNESQTEFKIVTPMEFRFVRGGNTKLSATYSDDGDEDWFCNLDLLAYIDYDEDIEGHRDKLYKFFADVERQWFGPTFNALPHHGKMFGFFDPTDSDTTSFSPPYNPKFFPALQGKRQEQANAFNSLRIEKGNLGKFSNDYVDSLVGTLPQ